MSGAMLGGVSAAHRIAHRPARREAPHMRTPIVPGRQDIGILFAALAAVFHLTSSSPAAASYVNFESQHVHPIALSADGSRLFAVNTPDNRLAVYSVTA